MANERTRALNIARPRSERPYVLYWMSHSQRADANPALERAVEWANELGRPLLVLFVVDPSYPEANARHFTFMLEGVKDAMTRIARRGAHFSLQIGAPPKIAARLAQAAAVVVTDRAYLRHLVAWRRELAEGCDALVEEVEGDVIVPVGEASTKLESAARTIRPKLHKCVSRFLTLPTTHTLKVPAADLAQKDDVALDDVAAFVKRLGVDDSVPPVAVRGGQTEARRRLTAFLKSDLAHYGEGRADIVDRHVSMMSPYLHYGHISPVEIHQRVRDAAVTPESADRYVEEMLVRRELAANFVCHAEDYDAWSALPAWARETLDAHKDDRREAVYTRRELEAGATGDRYWNAAMREMRVTGYLHNHMRMYWGKRILGWTNTPRYAFETTLYLNNKYLLDGRDMNSYANVGWIFGLHDRGWPERPVYGKVRTMTPGGLERKFDVDAYVAWAEAL
ncbi:deoxyribodipyrimidine photo-lyase [Acuticoccus mangrovi]|uniref:Deoxyribodipyrimidine photo-lyase n=1 Tax=Acuticoccus mangrovi TaxID=2796142 RepID=A0A934MG55_9HYPH|nr:deoxyribodipyrimidine photo-lyase [Acuticoccus mangrovi]MBJ3774596.1 deoxyribodipyrimidine photo-lyase [Acuticoccus mangrovi]